MQLLQKLFRWLLFLMFMNRSGMSLWAFLRRNKKSSSDGRLPQPLFPQKVIEETLKMRMCSQREVSDDLFLLIFHSSQETLVEGDTCWRRHQVISALPGYIPWLFCLGKVQMISVSFTINYSTKSLFSGSQAMFPLSQKCQTLAGSHSVKSLPPFSTITQIMPFAACKRKADIILFISFAS